MLLATATLLALGLPARSFAATVTEVRATVNFEDPDKFTDFNDSSLRTASGKKHYMAKIRELVELQANKLLPAGQKLTIIFTDIDLAGAFPASAPHANALREMRDGYSIPRMKFTYRVTDATGAVLKEGTEDVSEFNYTRSHWEESDPNLAMLRVWLEGKLKS